MLVRVAITIAAMVWLFYMASQPNWTEPLSGFVKVGVLLGGVTIILITGALVARILRS